MIKRLPLLLILFCSSVSLAFAQNVVKGTVSDKSGQPLIGATLTLSNETTGTKTYSSVGLDGTYIFRNLADGKYTIEAKYISYNAASKQFTAGGVVTVNLVLEDKNASLAEVSVTGHANRASDQSAINAERNAPVVLNAVSARTIEVSPDISIANVTQRVS